MFIPFFFHLRYRWLVRGRLYMPNQRYELHHKICNLRYGIPDTLLPLQVQSVAPRQTPGTIGFSHRLCSVMFSLYDNKMSSIFNAYKWFLLLKIQGWKLYSWTFICIKFFSKMESRAESAMKVEIISPCVKYKWICIWRTCAHYILHLKNRFWICRQKRNKTNRNYEKKSVENFTSMC